MYKTVLQVPVASDLRKQAEQEAIRQGLSSLQEAVRIFLKKLAERRVRIRLEEEETVQLSPRAIKRYDKIDEDFRKGRNVFTAKNVEELMRQLNA